MTKKDFELVADVLNDWVAKKKVRNLLFVTLGNAFEKSYPNFSKQKWCAAQKYGNKKMHDRRST